MQWERSQCYSSFRGGDAKTVQSCGTEKLRRQGIMMRMHCSRSTLQRANRRRKKEKWFWNYYCQNQGGMCYRRILVRVRRWAVMKMGLEDTTHDVLLSGLVPQFGSRRAPELASCHLLDEDVLLNRPRA